MRKLLVAGLAASLALGGLGLAQAEPGPNGNNNHGLCTAYFNGQKKGHEKNGNPGPFQALEDAAADADQSVFEFCEQFGIGGNPDHGRFPECFDDDENTGNDACPSE